MPSDYAEHAKLMMDLLALAYQTDLTRISTFMLAREVSGRAYPEIGVSDSHHPLSHHQDKPLNLERLHKVNEYHIQQFAYLVEKLAGDARRRRHAARHDAAPLRHGHQRQQHALPRRSADRAGGRQGDRDHRRAATSAIPKGTPLANLHVTLLAKLGVPVDKFGDATGKLDKLDDAMLSSI